MATERVTASLHTYRALPKVELHRHLEGSMRLSTLVGYFTMVNWVMNVARTPAMANATGEPLQAMPQ